MNKLKLLSLFIFPVIMAGCMSNSMNKNTTETKNTLPINATNLQHHNWILSEINGKKINVPEDFAVPNLEIGESLTANGHSGCNRYFGQGELKGNQFRIDKMASTMMICPQEAMDLETAMSSVLGEWSTMTLTKQELSLKGSEYELTFTLRDWVN